jgi:hypothetical protein
MCVEAMQRTIEAYYPGRVRTEGRRRKIELKHVQKI